MASTSTERVQRYRLCQSGDHSECNHRCEAYRTLLADNDFSMYAKAMIEELKRQRIKLADFLGDQLPVYREMARRTYPDYAYLAQVPDDVSYLRARTDIKLGCPSF